jgi:predicted transcriptional regulator
VTAVLRRERLRRVAELMQPLAATQAVAREDSLAGSVELMSRESLRQLPGVEQGRMAGVITPADALRVVVLRRALAD